MKIADLSSETLEKMKTLDYDRIYEKHEGPGHWKWDIEDNRVEFIETAGYILLLPINKKYYPNITFRRIIPSADAHTLTIFFQDTSFGNDKFDSGFLAICEKMPQENFYIATVYHEWFIIENPSLKDSTL